MASSVLSHHPATVAQHFKAEPGWCTPQEDIEGQVTTVSIALPF